MSLADVKGLLMKLIDDKDERDSFFESRPDEERMDRLFKENPDLAEKTLRNWVSNYCNGSCLSPEELQCVYVINSDDQLAIMWHKKGDDRKYRASDIRL